MIFFSCFPSACRSSLHLTRPAGLATACDGDCKLRLTAPPLLYLSFQPLGAKPKEEPTTYLLWDDGDAATGDPTAQTGSGLARIAAPKPKLPGHEESYNPPLEYLPTEEARFAHRACILFETRACNAVGLRVPSVLLPHIIISQEKEAMIQEEKYSGFKQFIPRAFDSMRKASRGNERKLTSTIHHTTRPLPCPQRIGSDDHNPPLPQVPAYPRFVNERFERCLDLYLCPRVVKQRINIDPKSLLPQLPKPRELQPFPTQELMAFTGHTNKAR